MAKTKYYRGPKAVLLPPTPEEIVCARLCLSCVLSQDLTQVLSIFVKINETLPDCPDDHPIKQLLSMKVKSICVTDPDSSFLNMKMLVERMASL